jgi:hypothetical protein
MKNGSFLEDKLKKENTQMRSVWAIPAPKNSEKAVPNRGKRNLIPG